MVPDMTYNVFGGTLNLAQSINPGNRLSTRLKITNRKWNALQTKTTWTNRL